MENTASQAQAPKRLNNSHLAMAVLAAAGRRPSDIARALGYSPHRVSVIFRSPLFQVEVERIRAELKTAEVDDLLERLRGEALPTLRTLIDIRDHGTSEDNTRLGAAKELKNWIGDSVPGLKGRAEREDGASVKIKLDMGTLGPLMEAVKKVSGGENPPAPVVEAEAAEEPAIEKIVPKTIDELLAERQEMYA